MATHTTITSTDTLRGSRGDVVVRVLDRWRSDDDPVEVAAALMSSRRCRVVVVVPPSQPGLARRLAAVGAVPVIAESRSDPAVASAIEFLRGLAPDEDPPRDPALGPVTASPFTAQEARVLVAAVGESTTAQIADAVGLAPGTVRNHLTAILAKTGARRRTASIRLAVEQGWI